MATLILSTVGTAVGGPVGGALGSLVGQAIDTNLFGDGPKRGPRLDDLKVQTSSYGTQIPRIYGRMRVAGTIVWATDLQESEQIEGGGKGGPEVMRYAYSCSFAVALSSRPIRDVGRIWADGILIRGAAGDLKVKTSLRILQGGEEQEADPLISTVEGAGGTPAYRGLALVIFEDLDLTEFGNRLPMLTFEVVADEDDGLGVVDVVGDVCGATTIDSGAARDLVGFAAMGSDRRAAIQGLIDLNDLRIGEGEDELRLFADQASKLVDLERDAGWTGDRKSQPGKGEWTRDAATSVPEALTVRYHEPARDYQAGAMRATAEGGRGEAMVDSAAALDAATAKQWASQALARQWTGRDRLTLSLSTDWIGLMPGERIAMSWRSGLWTVEEVLIEAFAVKVSFRRAADGGPAMAAEPGRAIAQADAPIGASVVGLFELPALNDNDAVELLAAVSCVGGFKRVSLLTEVGDAEGPVGFATRKARLGVTEDCLSAGQAERVDARTSIVVRLVDASQLIFNADRDALDRGANLAMIGDELIQFGRAESLGDGRYRLSQLLRGRRGTEWAIDGHQTDEPFVMVDPAATVALAFDAASIGGTVQVSAIGVADDPSAPPNQDRTLTGASAATLSPCHLHISGGAAKRLSWVARSRQRWAWEGSDEGVPLQSFAIEIVGSAGSLTRTMAGVSLVFTAGELAALGAGPATAFVRTIGARRSSEAASITFHI